MIERVNLLLLFTEEVGGGLPCCLSKKGPSSAAFSLALKGSMKTYCQWEDVCGVL